MGQHQRKLTFAAPATAAPIPVCTGAHFRISRCPWLLLLPLLLGTPRASSAQAPAQTLAQASPARASLPPVAAPTATHSTTISSAAATLAPSDLPDAPEASRRLPEEESTSARTAYPALAITALPTADSVQPSVPVGTTPPVFLRDCPYDQTHARDCRVHWHQLFISSSLFIAFQNAGNAYTGFYYRYETTHGKWLDRYFNSVTGYKFSVWSDGNPRLDDYVGHPYMGAITSYLWIQNDPRGMTLEASNTRAYWHSRLRALAFATAYSTEWKLGPFGESGIGHAGDHVAYDNGRYRVETGFVSLVTTPIGGALWGLAEDQLDRRLFPRLEGWSRNPFALFAYQFLSPGRGAANILRFRPPWYRDSRVVKATSFWSDPGPGTSGLTTRLRHAPRENLAAEDPADSSSSSAKSSPAENTAPEPAPSPAAAAAITPASVPPPPDLRPGGTHELGAWWGLSLVSSDVIGSEKDVRYMPIDVRYSYRFLDHPRWALRYSPEITALAMLDSKNWDAVDMYTQRRRTYGSGLSPVGFQATFAPSHRVQPFAGFDGGFIYFADRVLSPQGSQYMWTADISGGVNIFRKRNQAVTLGYRYQHLSNANISHHNPGTDANTFYVGVSRFQTKPRIRRPPSF